MSRLLLAAAIVAGISYMGSWSLTLPAWAATAWKGSGVALLALYAASVARSGDGWTIALVMLLGALGDVLLETHGLEVGAVAFFAGHLVAVWLYLKNRRAVGRGEAAALALVPLAVAAIAWALPPDHAQGAAAALYSLGLGAMAAAAWASRFPRALTALGAFMFVASDLLIFARAGPLAQTAGVGVAVWVLYFGGQLLIVLGVTRTLGRAQAVNPG